MTATPTAPATTREQILQVADGLIKTRSYLGFSFQDVADQVGIRKASLYHHFPTKEALGVEVLREATLAFRQWSERRSTDPRAALASYFRMYRDALHAGDGVCPAVAVASGWGVVNPELQQTVRELRNTQILWLTGVLGALGRPSPTGSISQWAASVYATCQGALVSARITGKVEDFDEAIAQLRTDLTH